MFKGLYTALITPFNAEGELDESGLSRLIKHQIDAGVEGIVVLGTTGESPTLTQEEKRRVVEITVAEAKGKTMVMVGTGCNSTKHTVEWTQEAHRLGADAALIVSPYYNRPTQEGLIRHFTAISQATPLPICVYNIPGRTGQNITPESLAKMALCKNIVGVKEASGNINQMADILSWARKHRPDFSLLSGDDALILPVCALGGKGIISVVSNLLPTPMKGYVDAALKYDIALAQEFHFKLLPLFKAAFLETNPAPIKAAMQLCNLPSGSCRLPLSELMSHTFDELKQTLLQLPKQWIPTHG